MVLMEIGKKDVERECKIGRNAMGDDGGGLRKKGERKEEES
jgi:hypothetical protein